MELMAGSTVSASRCDTFRLVPYVSGTAVVPVSVRYVTYGVTVCTQLSIRTVTLPTTVLSLPSTP